MKSKLPHINFTYVIATSALLIFAFTHLFFTAGWKLHHVINPSDPGAILAYIPRPTQEAYRFLSQNKTDKIEYFSLSPKIKADNLMNQRFHEIFYPIRISDGSTTVISYPDEVDFQNCDRLFAGKYILIHDCQPK